MPKVIFEGETNQEIVQQVRRWLDSQTADDEGRLSASQAVNQGAGLTKDALRLVASSAPRPVAQNELVKGLTDMGYKATDATRDALVQGLDSLDQLSGGAVVKRVTQRGASVVYEMNAAVARGVLKSLTGG